MQIGLLNKDTRIEIRNENLGFINGWKTRGFLITWELRIDFIDWNSYLWISLYLIKVRKCTLGNRSIKYRSAARKYTGKFNST